MVPSSPSDPLVERLRRLDSLAFDTLYQREKDGLYGFLLRLARDPNTAADLFQNVWLKLASHAPRLRPDSNLRAWLFTVARHEYVSFRRAQALDLSRLLLLGLQPARPPRTAELDPRLAELDAAFAELGDPDREVLLLSVADGLDATAGGQVLGISPPAFRQRLARARRRLEERLQVRAEAAPGASAAHALKGER
jgi:RNA polymerase sigma factor (sigma-70 family)